MKISSPPSADETWVSIDNEFGIGWSARRASNLDRTLIRSLLCQLSYEPVHYMIPSNVRRRHVASALMCVIQ